jgi:hypothetical protein
MSVLVVCGLAATSCGGDDDSGAPEADPPGTESSSTTGEPETTTDAPSPSDVPGKGEASLWLGNACELLTDADVAAAMDGRAPTSTEPADTNTVAADGYGGVSCRWKVSVADHLVLDIFPAADVSFEELAAYDPQDRWSPEPLGGVGDEAWVQRWNGTADLPVAPGSVGAIVVRQGDVGLRLAITAGYPPGPDGLTGAALVILESDS